MDNQDAEYYYKAIQSVSENEQRMKDGMEENVKVLSHLNKQVMESIKNSNVTVNKINEVINELNQVSISEGNLNRTILLASYYDDIVNKINHKIMQLEIEIEQIIDSLLFIQAGILHPRIIEPTDLLNELRELEHDRILAIEPNTENYSEILKILELKAFTKDQQIIIVINVPTVTKETYDIYEIVTIPKIVENGIVILALSHKYLIINKAREEYSLKENLDDCKIFNKMYICKPQLLRSTVSDFNCEINIFMRNRADNCNVKTINSKIEIFHRIKDNSFLFTITEETSYTCKCNNNTENGKLYGSGIIIMNNNCKLETYDMTIKTLDTDVDVNLKDKYSYGELEDCCINTKMRDIIINQQPMSKITAKDIHELQDLSSEIQNQRNFWSKTLNKIPERSQGVLMSVFGTISLITIGYFIWKCNCGSGRTTINLFSRCFNRRHRVNAEMNLSIPDELNQSTENLELRTSKSNLRIKYP